MSDSKLGESDKHGKKKAKTRDLEDGRLSFRSSPSSPWHGMKNVPDGGIEYSGDVSAWKLVEDGGEEELDPLMVFGSGIMMIILSKLDARSVAQARLVSPAWSTVASSDEIWAPKDLFHMFRNGILNGDPIQIYLPLFCMEDYDSPFWGTMSCQPRGIGRQRFCFTFVYVCYKIIGSNREEKCVFPLMSWSSSVNQQDAIICDGLSENLKIQIWWCT